MRHLRARVGELDLQNESVKFIMKKNIARNLIGNKLESGKGEVEECTRKVNKLLIK